MGMAQVWMIVARPARRGTRRPARQEDAEMSNPRECFWTHTLDAMRSIINAVDELRAWEGEPHPEFLLNARSFLDYAQGYLEEADRVVAALQGESDG